MKGSLYKQNGSWCVRWSTKDAHGKRLNHFAKIATLAEYPQRREVKLKFENFMQSVDSSTASKVSPGLTVSEFVEKHYLPYVERVKSASTSHGYRGLWQRYVATRALADLRVIQVRTVDIRQLLLAVQRERSLSKHTQQHFKSFLSAVFTYAQNEGLIQSNPVHGTLLPEDTTAPRDTHAYDLAAIQKMLGALSGAPRAFVAIAGLAGLRLGEIQALRWEDISNDEIWVRRSDWKGKVSKPKTAASQDAVPVIPTLHRSLEDYRAEMGKPVVGELFDMRLEKLATRTVKPIVEGIGLSWHGAHALRRGIATNLYSLGATDKIVQRVLRHARATVTKEKYIKSIPKDVTASMLNLDKKIASGTLTVHGFGSPVTASA